MKALSSLYYRYLFLRRNTVARALVSLIGRPKVPTKKMWDTQYANGHWERLKDLCEQAHGAVAASYVAYLKPNSSVLEIGCGEGILLPRLREIGYRAYTGIDISEFAIGKCRTMADEKTRFIVGDAEQYVPDTPVDVILLNESIYYFVEPIACLCRYAERLAPGGVFIVSMFDKERTRPIRRALKETFRVIDETIVSNSKGTWYCSVLGSERLNGESSALDGVAQVRVLAGISEK